jgi:site-specific recombinase XerD
MARRTVTDQALPDGVYPYTLGSGEQRYYAKLASGATKRGFTTARAASRHKKAKDSAPAKPKETRGTFKALWPEYLRARRPYLVRGAYDDYDRHGRLRLIPKWGEDKVAAITKSEIQDWLADLDEDEEFAPKTINNALRVLQAFFNWLVDDKELLDRSPARKVEPLPEDLFEADWLRPHEIPVYLEACTVEYRPLAELLIGGGPRISEALAIEVDDIDPDRQVISVLRQARKGATAKRGGRRRRDVARTKGKNYRQIAVSRRVINLLLDHIARLSEQFPLQGDSRVFVRHRPAPPEAIAMTPAARTRREAIAADLIAGSGSQRQTAERHGVSQQLVSLVARALVAEKPEPLTRNLISQDWHKETLKRAALRSSVRLHDLRHTAATYWLIQGEPLYFVQRQLGHRDSRTTERYEHMAASYLAQRVDRHDDALWLPRPTRQEAAA